MAEIVQFPDRAHVEREAADWLIRLDRSTEPSVEEIRALREWLRRGPVHREELANLARLWGNMNVLTELAVPLGNVAGSQEAGSHVVRQRRALRYSVAAVGVLAALGFTFSFFDGRPSDSITRTNGLYVTEVGGRQSIELADGSVVDLNTNSEIRVEYTEQYRDIEFLRGEALFTVAENDSWRFRVSVAGKRVEAVGTAFAVHLKGAEVQVTVSEGKIALVARNTELADPLMDRNAPEEELLGTLDAGEVGILAEREGANADSDTILQRIELADIDRMLSWREGLLVFSGESLETVVAEISRYTTVRIDLSDRALGAIRIGGQVPVGEIDAMLAALEENFGLSVQRLNSNHVLLSAAVD